MKNGRYRHGARSLPVETGACGSSSDECGSQYTVDYLNIRVSPPAQALPH